MKRDINALVIMCVVFFLSLILFRVSTIVSSSSSEQLPTNLVFTGKLTQDSAPTLVFLDAMTLEATPLYTDESAIQLRAMSWSPQGDLLAVLRIEKSDNENFYPTAICIVTLTGELQTCFDDKPPVWYAVSPFLIDYEYTVTWSTDGTKVYFVTEDVQHTMRRLIEADVVTGATLRPIYEVAAMNEDQIPTVIIWTPNLEYVAAGVGLTERSGTLVNLDTGRQLDLSTVVIAWPYGTDPSRPEGSGYICNGFSPQNSYLTAINEYDNRLIIFDKELNILHTVQDFGIDGRVKIYCPTWSADDSTIYFFVLNLDHEPNYIFTYSLQDDRLVSRVADAVYPPLVFSPDRTHIAFEIPHPSTSKIHVLYPDNTIRLLGDPFLYAQYPVWKPN